MFGNINPAQMKAMMRQMGIKQEEVETIRVIIEKTDGRIVIEPAQVQKMTMQGQDSWQITGSAREESLSVSISEEDIQIIVEKTGKSKEEARKALEETGDIAEAILALSE